jgi:hypothetical protein
VQRPESLARLQRRQPHTSGTWPRVLVDIPCDGRAIVAGCHCRRALKLAFPRACHSDCRGVPDACQIGLLLWRGFAHAAMSVVVRSHRVFSAEARRLVDRRILVMKFWKVALKARRLTPNVPASANPTPSLPRSQSNPRGKGPIRRNSLGCLLLDVLFRYFQESFHHGHPSTRIICTEYVPQIMTELYYLMFHWMLLPSPVSKHVRQSLHSLSPHLCWCTSRAISHSLGCKPLFLLNVLTSLAVPT